MMRPLIFTVEDPVQRAFNLGLAPVNYGKIISSNGVKMRSAKFRKLHKAFMGHIASLGGIAEAGGLYQPLQACLKELMNASTHANEVILETLDKTSASSQKGSQIIRILEARQENLNSTLNAIINLIGKIASVPTGSHQRLLIKLINRAIDLNNGFITAITNPNGYYEKLEHDRIELNKALRLLNKVLDSFLALSKTSHARDHKESKESSDDIASKLPLFLKIFDELLSHHPNSKQQKGGLLYNTSLDTHEHTLTFAPLCLEIFRDGLIALIGKDSLYCELLLPHINKLDPIQMSAEELSYLHQFINHVLLLIRHHDREPLFIFVQELSSLRSKKDFSNVAALSEAAISLLIDDAIRQLEKASADSRNPSREQQNLIRIGRWALGLSNSKPLEAFKVKYRVYKIINNPAKTRKAAYEVASLFLKNHLFIALKAYQPPPANDERYQFLVNAQNIYLGLLSTTHIKRIEELPLLTQITLELCEVIASKKISTIHDWVNFLETMIQHIPFQNPKFLRVLTLITLDMKRMGFGTPIQWKVSDLLRESLLHYSKLLIETQQADLHSEKYAKSYLTLNNLVLEAMDNPAGINPAVIQTLISSRVPLSINLAEIIASMQLEMTLRSVASLPGTPASMDGKRESKRGESKHAEGKRDSRPEVSLPGTVADQHDAQGDSKETKSDRTEPRSTPLPQNNPQLVRFINLGNNLLRIRISSQHRKEEKTAAKLKQLAQLKMWTHELINSPDGWESIISGSGDSIKDVILEYSRSDLDEAVEFADICACLLLDKTIKEFSTTPTTPIRESLITRATSLLSQDVSTIATIAQKRSLIRTKLKMIDLLKDPELIEKPIQTMKSDEARGIRYTKGFGLIILFISALGAGLLVLADYLKLFALLSLPIGLIVGAAVAFVGLIILLVTLVQNSRLEQKTWKQEADTLIEGSLQIANSDQAFEIGVTPLEIAKFPRDYSMDEKRSAEVKPRTILEEGTAEYKAAHEDLLSSHFDSLPNQTPAPTIITVLDAQGRKPQVAMPIEQQDVSEDKRPNLLKRVSADELNKAFAEDWGNNPLLAEGLNEEGLNYLKNKNFQKAIECFSLAAAEDHADAFYNLGRCAREGLGVPKDEAIAIGHFEKSAERGNAAAAYELHQFYARRKEQKEAAYWLNASTRAHLSKLSILEKSAEAFEQYQLGCRYQLGLGAPQDLHRAKELFKQAANNGNSNARTTLQVMRELGEKRKIEEKESKSSVSLEPIGVWGPKPQVAAGDSKRSSPAKAQESKIPDQILPEHFQEVKEGESRNLLEDEIHPQGGLYETKGEETDSPRRRLQNGIAAVKDKMGGVFSLPAASPKKVCSQSWECSCPDCSNPENHDELATRYGLDEMGKRILQEQQDHARKMGLVGHFKQDPSSESKADKRQPAASPASAPAPKPKARPETKGDSKGVSPSSKQKPSSPPATPSEPEDSALDRAVDTLLDAGSKVGDTLSSLGSKALGYFS